MPCSVAHRRLGPRVPRTRGRRASARREDVATALRSLRVASRDPSHRSSEGRGASLAVCPSALAVSSVGSAALAAHPLLNVSAHIDTGTAVALIKTMAAEEPVIAGLTRELI